MINKLCRYFLGKGYTPILFHFGHEELEKRVADLGIETVLLQGEDHYKSIKTLPLFAKGFRKTLRDYKIDVLHSHLFGPSVAGAFGTCLTGIPHIGTLHDTFIVEERPARIHLLELAALIGTRLVTVSREMEAYYRRRGFFSSSRLRTIYNGVALFDECSSDMRSTYREEFGVAKDEILLVSTGRLVPLKRFDVQIRAIAQLPREIPCKLLIAGEGPEEDSLKGLISELGVVDRVELIGFKERVQQLLWAADGFILTSDTEGLSTSVLEAMSASLPVVATDVGGNCELVVEGENGYLAPAGDSKAVAQLLLNIVNDPSLRRRFGGESRSRVEQKFSNSIMCRSYEGLYDALG
ncbi:MAG: glycosyltransferase family 4 protein [Bdellovibrionales bacterium]|nr:glycosyltransferase family 4 protein [Bdellovibrionales bacterium]